MRRKYEQLHQYLLADPSVRLTLNFSHLDRLVGGLPSSARNHRAWWANSTRGNHSWASAWLDADFAVDEVNLTAGTVTFVRT